MRGELPTQSTEALHAARADRIADGGIKLYSGLLTKKGEESKLMLSDPQELKAFLLEHTPPELKTHIRNTIMSAIILLQGVRRRDGTPHIHHALRVAVRTMKRAIAEQGSITADNIHEVAVAINHDSQEDARHVNHLTKGEVRDTIKKFAPDTSERTLKDIDTFDQYSEIYGKNGKLIERKDYEEDIRSNGLGPIKMDDTLDSMAGDMAKASSYINHFYNRLADNSLTQDDRDLITKALAQLTKSCAKTARRLEFFKEGLTDRHTEHIEIYIHGAQLFISELESVQQQFPPIIPSQRGGEEGSPHSRRTLAPVPVAI